MKIMKILQWSIDNSQYSIVTLNDSETFFNTPLQGSIMQEKYTLFPEFFSDFAPVILGHLYAATKGAGF